MNPVSLSITLLAIAVGLGLLDAIITWREVRRIERLRRQCPADQERLARLNALLREELPDER